MSIWFIAFLTILAPATGVSSRTNAETAPAATERYVTVLEGDNFVFSDLHGHSTANSVDSVYQGEVPGASPNWIDDHSVNCMFVMGQTYRVAFSATSEPIFIEVLTGADNEHPTAAVRYLDVVLPAGTKVLLTLPAEGNPSVRYDSQGTGRYDALVQPTASVTGALAANTQPPIVTFSFASAAGGILVTVTAKDQGIAGIRKTLYSIDGSHFQPYTGPFVVSPNVRRVYAFSEDNAGNRSWMYDAAVRIK